MYAKLYISANGILVATSTFRLKKEKKKSGGCTKPLPPLTVLSALTRRRRKKNYGTILIQFPCFWPGDSVHNRSTKADLPKLRACFVLSRH